MSKNITKICEECDKEYKTKHSSQKYCCLKCSGKAYSKQYKGISKQGD